MEPVEHVSHKQPLTPEWDPWDPWYTRHVKGRYELTSVEFTVTQLCNLRCEHCAVGEMLAEVEGNPIPVEQLIRRLEEVDTLQTLSITGGEPVFNPETVKEIIRPLLRYARERGIYTQVNSNLTLPLSRYEEWVEDVDVLHISYNYRDASGLSSDRLCQSQTKSLAPPLAEKLFTQMVENAKALSRPGSSSPPKPFSVPLRRPILKAFTGTWRPWDVSATKSTPCIPATSPGIWSSSPWTITGKTVRRLLKAPKAECLDPVRNSLPFYPCSSRQEDIALWRELHREEGVTVRHDPDGRNRLNVNIFTGDIIVTDFGDVPPLGNILRDRLDRGL